MAKVEAFQRLIEPAAGVILDFDGLLADSERYHFLSYDEVFARYGHRLDETEYYRYWTSLGHGVKGEIERHNLDLDPVAIREEKLPIFSRYCEDGSIKLFDEAVELLKRLGRSRKQIAIASGSYPSDIRAVLRNAGMDCVVGVILGYDDAPKLKPAPDIFLKALELMDLSARECVVFEDAEKGMFAAIHAGIPVVIVRTPETRHIDFSDADLTFDSHAEMIDVLRRSPLDPLS